MLELYHFVVIHVLLFLTFLKLLMLCEGLLFVRIGSYGICTLDNLEVFPLTPRYLALFTVSFLAFSDFIGKTTTDLTQHNFQKGCPFFIAALHTCILIMRRRYLFTVDDVIAAALILTSLVLYLSLELKQTHALRALVQKQIKAKASVPVSSRKEEIRCNKDEIRRRRDAQYL